MVGLIKEAQKVKSTGEVPTTASVRLLRLRDRELALRGWSLRPLTSGKAPLHAHAIELTPLQHSWNEKTGQYETVEASCPGQVKGLDEYVFVARARIDKYTPI